MQLYQYFQARGGGITLSVNKYNILREIEVLNTSKADIDLANTTPAQNFKEMSIDWCMPDYENGIDIKNFSSSSKQYTVPAHGVINVSTENYGRIYLNNKDFMQVIGVAPNGAGGSINANCGYVFPVRKGDKVYFINSNTSSPWSKFYPYKGANT